MKIPEKERERKGREEWGGEIGQRAEDWESEFAKYFNKEGI